MGPEWQTAGLAGSKFAYDIQQLAYRPQLKAECSPFLMIKSAIKRHLMKGRAVITHLLCMAVGLALGIFLTKNSAPLAVTESAPVETTPTSLVNSNQTVNSTTAPAVDSLDADLTRMRNDYEDQIRRGEQRQALF